MTAYDASGMEPVAFDGRVAPPRTSRRHRYASAHHGPACFQAIGTGCVCGEVERAGLRAERREARP